MTTGVFGPTQTQMESLSNGNESSWRSPRGVARRTSRTGTAKSSALVQRPGNTLTTSSQNGNVSKKNPANKTKTYKPRGPSGPISAPSVSPIPFSIIASSAFNPDACTLDAPAPPEVLSSWEDRVFPDDPDSVVVDSNNNNGPPRVDGSLNSPSPNSESTAERGTVRAQPPPQPVDRRVPGSNKANSQQMKSADAKAVPPRSQRSASSSASIAKVEAALGGGCPETAKEKARRTFTPLGLIVDPSSFFAEPPGPRAFAPSSNFRPCIECHLTPAEVYRHYGIRVVTRDPTTEDNGILKLLKASLVNSAISLCIEQNEPEKMPAYSCMGPIYFTHLVQCDANAPRRPLSPDYSRLAYQVSRVTPWVDYDRYLAALVPPPLAPPPPVGDMPPPPPAPPAAAAAPAAGQVLAAPAPAVAPGPPAQPAPAAAPPPRQVVPDAPSDNKVPDGFGVSATAAVWNSYDGSCEPVEGDYLFCLSSNQIANCPDDYYSAKTQGDGISYLTSPSGHVALKTTTRRPNSVLTTPSGAQYKLCSVASKGGLSICRLDAVPRDSSEVNGKAYPVTSVTLIEELPHGSWSRSLLEMFGLSTAISRTVDAPYSESIAESIAAGSAARRSTSTTEDETIDLVRRYTAVAQSENLSSQEKSRLQPGTIQRAVSKVLSHRANADSAARALSQSTVTPSKVLFLTAAGLVCIYGLFRLRSRVLALARTVLDWLPSLPTLPGYFVSGGALSAAADSLRRWLVWPVVALVGLIARALGLGSRPAFGICHDLPRPVLDTPVFDVCCASNPVRPQAATTQIIDRLEKHPLSTESRLDKRHREPYFPADELCQPKVRRYIGFLGGMPSEIVPRDCRHNEYLALRNRHGFALQPAPLWTDGRFLTHVSSVLPGHRLCPGYSGPHLDCADLRSWLESYKGIQKEKYSAALEHIELEGWPAYIDGRITAMIKDEGYFNVSPLPGSNLGPDPRTIMSGKPEAVLAHASFSVPYGKWLKEEWSMPAAYPNKPVLIYTSGYNSGQLGSMFERACSWFPSGRFLKCDGSRFDANLGPEAINFEIQGITGRFRDDGSAQYSHARRAFYDTLDNRGATRHFWFSSQARRKSGHHHTSCGNSTLNGLMLSYALHSIGVHHYVMFVLGDDNLIVLNEDISPAQLRDMVSVLSGFGMVAKLEKVDSPVWAEFCSGWFVPAVVEGRVTLVWTPKPFRLLTKTLHYKADHQDAKLASSVESVSHQTSHCPVVSPVIAAVAKRIAGWKRSRKAPYSIEGVDAQFHASSLQYYLERYGMGSGWFDAWNLFWSTARLPVTITDAAVQSYASADFSRDVDSDPIQGIRQLAVFLHPSTSADLSSWSLATVAAPCLETWFQQTLLETLSAPKAPDKGPHGSSVLSRFFSSLLRSVLVGTFFGTVEAIFSYSSPQQALPRSIIHSALSLVGSHSPVLATTLHFLFNWQFWSHRGQDIGPGYGPFISYTLCLFWHWTLFTKNSLARALSSSLKFRIFAVMFAHPLLSKLAPPDALPLIVEQMEAPIVFQAELNYFLALLIYRVKSLVLGTRRG